MTPLTKKLTHIFSECGRNCVAQLAYIRFFDIPFKGNSRVPLVSGVNINGGVVDIAQQW
jgi:hypothetical protein